MQLWPMNVLQYALRVVALLGREAGA